MGNAEKSGTLHSKPIFMPGKWGYSSFPYFSDIQRLEMIRLKAAGKCQKLFGLNISKETLISKIVLGVGGGIFDSTLAPLQGEQLALDVAIYMATSMAICHTQITLQNASFPPSSLLFRDKAHKRRDLHPTIFQQEPAFFRWFRSLCRVNDGQHIF